MGSVDVCEVFTSLQGESTFAGWLCFFVRLAGCNLRCRYCDARRAWGPGKRVPVAEIVEACRGAGTPIAEITGGEPLLQAGFRDLAAGLRDEAGKQAVLVETNGTQDLSAVPEDVVAIVDVKCPGSGEGGSFDPANIGRLRSYDEVKFVLRDRADYAWARDFVCRHDLAPRCRAVHFSPVHGVLDAADVGRWIMADGLGVRLQLQLHKMLGVR